MAVDATAVEDNDHDAGGAMLEPATPWLQPWHVGVGRQPSSLRAW